MPRKEKELVDKEIFLLPILYRFCRFLCFFLFVFY